MDPQQNRNCMPVFALVFLGSLVAGGAGVSGVQAGPAAVRLPGWAGVVAPDLMPAMVPGRSGRDWFAPRPGDSLYAMPVSAMPDADFDLPVHRGRGDDLRYAEPYRTPGLRWTLEDRTTLKAGYVAMGGKRLPRRAQPVDPATAARSGGNTDLYSVRPGVFGLRADFAW